MRLARIKAEGNGWYHCLSRVVDRRMIFEDPGKEMFRRMMRQLAEFCGVRIMTYAVLGNHFHILLHVPEREDISDSELIRRLRILYKKAVVADFANKLKQARQSGNIQEVERLRNLHLYRMYDVSQYMKSLKQRFSVWYNRRNNRKGTLWEERFKSILIEGGKFSKVQTSALALVGAYIDLNAVRAGIVEDPKDYRFCGYGEAVGGGKEARAGLTEIAMAMNVKGPWKRIAAEYRKFLYEAGQVRESSREGLIRPAFTLAQVMKVVDEGGQLTRAEALRCRVRYFSDGVVLGSREFVAEMFGRHRDQFGRKRCSGPRTMKWSDWGGLCTIRELRKDVVTVPGAG